MPAADSVSGSKHELVVEWRCTNRPPRLSHGAKMERTSGNADLSGGPHRDEEIEQLVPMQSTFATAKLRTNVSITGNIREKPSTRVTTLAMNVPVSDLIHRADAHGARCC